MKTKNFCAFCPHSAMCLSQGWEQKDIYAEAGYECIHVVCAHTVEASKKTITFSIAMERAKRAMMDMLI